MCPSGQEFLGAKLKRYTREDINSFFRWELRYLAAYSYTMDTHDVVKKQEERRTRRWADWVYITRKEVLYFLYRGSGFHSVRPRRIELEFFCLLVLRRGV